MSLLSREVQEHYLKSQESQRLSSGQGELERVRTQAIFTRELPSPPAVVFDIGGGAGIHAFWLAQRGYQVHLIDPVELHLEQARSHETASGVALASITCGDVRMLEITSGTADAVLLLGPLYHLTERRDRIQALGEARRILRPKGILLAAAISRFASLIDGLSRGFFRDGAFRDCRSRSLFRPAPQFHEQSSQPHISIALKNSPPRLMRPVSATFVSSPSKALHGVLLSSATLGAIPCSEKD